MSAKPWPRKVAIVHDWLIGGGAERVVYELHLMFPDAPIYTSYRSRACVSLSPCYGNGGFLIWI